MPGQRIKAATIADLNPWTAQGFSPLNTKLSSYLPNQHIHRMHDNSLVLRETFYFTSDTTSPDILQTSTAISIIVAFLKLVPGYLNRQ